jgi:hypothetical protein
MKALMLIHRLFQDGDPSFEREVLQGMRRGARLLNLSDLEMIHTQMLGTIPHLYAHMPCISMSALIALFWGNVNLLTDLIRVRGPGHIVISNLVPPVVMNIAMGVMVVAMATDIAPTIMNLVMGAHGAMVTDLLLVIMMANRSRMRKRGGIVGLLQSEI